MGALLIGLDKILSIIDRCKIYEILYLRDPHPTEALTNFESALVKLYAVILQFLSKAIQLFDKNTASRAIHGFWSPDDVTDFENKCQTLEEQVEIEVKNCERFYNRVARAEDGRNAVQLKLLLQDMKQSISRLDTTVTTLGSRSAEAKREVILSWTSNIFFRDDHDSACQGRTIGTAEWLLQHDKYRKWQSSNESMILWLNGIRWSSLPYIGDRRC